jgi:OmpR family response regulator RpaB
MMPWGKMSTTGEERLMHETTTRPRILCVEDEAGMLDLLRLILETAGYVFLSARDGLEGLEAMRQEQPDLVLLDLMLPKLDGAGVLLHKKNDPRIKEIPVIAVTALASPFDQIMWKRHTEIKEYLTKPFTRKDLLETIESVLARKSEGSGPQV